MSEIAKLRQFYRFNRSVRTNYLKTFSTIPAEELLRDRGASYPSILDIFTHVLDAYESWFNIIEGRDTGDMVSASSLEEAVAIENRIGTKVCEVVEGLSEKDLEREVELGDAPPARLGDICWHMVEEEFQHRGEINALLWQMNVEPPVGDYSDWMNAAKKG